MSPPLRDQRNQEILWPGLRDGLVQTVATDHAPFDFKTQKPKGRDDFTKIANPKRVCKFTKVLIIPCLGQGSQNSVPANTALSSRRLGLAGG